MRAAYGFLDSPHDRVADADPDGQGLRVQHRWEELLHHGREQGLGLPRREVALCVRRDAGRRLLRGRHGVLAARRKAALHAPDRARDLTATAVWRLISRTRTAADRARARRRSPTRRPRTNRPRSSWPG